jgi:hypothetical protein
MPASVAAIASPTITLWHGNTQSFGQLGNPQYAINILGNVADPNGIQSLTYTLNGGSPVALSRGPDSRRLLKPGDFNIDINTADLNSGANTIVITATNNASQTSSATVTVNYTPGVTWQHNYSITWSTAGTVTNVAQPVDGDWTISGNIVRTTNIGYDRLLAIGDRTWTDYEVTVPITIISIDSSAIPDVTSQGPGVGLLFRWTGHTDNPISGWQPKTGYLPFGAIGWYKWGYLNPAEKRFRLEGNNLNLMQQDNSGFHMLFGVTYMFKMRVETIAGVGGAYKLKVWQQGQPEPPTWLLQGQGSMSDPQAGCFALLSHHVNAEFGDVTVTSLSNAFVIASVKTFLEGPFNASSTSMLTSLHPVMPLSQPYHGTPWNYNGTESVVTLPPNVVDWVLLELRTGTSSSTIVARRAAFLKNNGMVVDLDGTSAVTFNGISPGMYYIVVRHRNHLAIMTASAQSLGTSATTYDFTTGQAQAYGTAPMAQLAANVFGMYVGDANASGVVTAADANAIFGQLNATGYSANDVNLSAIVTASDANLVMRNLNQTSQVP